MGDFHLIGDLGGRIPFDMGAETTQLFWNLHASYTVLKWLVPFVEFGGLYYSDDGDGSFKVKLGDDAPVSSLPVSALNDIYGRFDGVDVANLGGVDVDNRSIVIFTAGLRFPIGDHWMLGASYDTPITSVNDVWKQRVTLNVNLEF